ncbi:Carbamoyl-phosphate synthase small chain [Candidatus Vidania fulgoroideae]|nr:Carbamoyl-phosphate synthase small chain [Candidatus Vidania fulgoroideae]
MDKPVVSVSKTNNLFMKKKVIVKLNNKKFLCRSIGHKKNFFGNAVFNTSNVGYVESLTDPSYLNQILVLNSINIGNVGFCFNDIESCRFFLSGIIVNNISSFFSSRSSKCSLLKILKEKRVIVLENSDIRGLVNEIKKKKSCKIKIEFNKKKIEKKKICKKSYIFSSLKNKFKIKILFLDFGAKFSILKELNKRNFFVISISEKEIKKKITKFNPDGIVLSNGPGKPKKHTSKIKKIKKYIGKIPILGICLGHQILSNYFGLKIVKMKSGHHCINHPIKFLSKVFITSQNHNYCVINRNKKKQPFSLIDGSNQGLIIKEKKIITVQGHPESSPGPKCFLYVFDLFLSLFIF